MLKFLYERRFPHERKKIIILKIDNLYYDFDGIVFTCGSSSYMERIYHFAYSDYIGG